MSKQGTENGGRVGMTMLLCTLLCVVAVSVQMATAQTSVTDNVVQPTTESPEADCVDVLPIDRCQFWARFGVCKSFPERMNASCRRTCNLCYGICSDFNNAKCRWLAAHSACVTHPKRMAKICPQTCGNCIGRAPTQPRCAKSTFGCCWDGTTAAKGAKGEGCQSCRNTLRLCRYFVDDCFFGSRNRGFMRLNCPRTCGMCARVTT